MSGIDPNAEIAPDAPDGGPMDPETVQSVVAALLQDAKQYVDEELSPARAKAAEYYAQKPFGNEEEGRNQFISADVRDAILQTMPDMLRVFMGPENSVEFVAETAEKQAEAELRTQYANYVFRQDNNGFLLTHNSLKDGFLKKIGVIKAWWEDTPRVQRYPFSGLDQAQVTLLSGEAELEELTPAEDGTFSGVALKRSYRGCIRMEVVPPEELLYGRSARDSKTAPVVSHTRDVILSDLVAMGFSKEDILAKASTHSGSDDNAETLARNEQTSSLQDDKHTQDQSGWEVLYSEAYVLIDRDGDGVQELRKFHAVGDNFTLIDRTLPDGTVVKADEGEPVSRRPFAIYTPDPEPHSITGHCLADYTMDIQRLKSNVIRGTIDSLNLTLHPRTWAVLGQVEPSDLLNNEIGGIVRMKQPGMAGEFVHEFVGKESFPMLGYLDEVKESRTGRSKASAGLDADALQSSTKAAVTATITAAQARSELLARIYAEFMAEVFLLISHLTIEHQDEVRQVKLGNQFVTIDPRTWDAEMGIRVMVALGAGMTEDRINVLMGIAAKQEQILQTMGMVNPLVRLDQYRNTLARITRLRGFANDEEFWQPLTRKQAEQMAQQAASKPAEPSPEMMIAQAQMQAIAAETQLKQQEFQLKQQEAMLKAQEMAFKQQLEQEKLTQEMLLKTKELELKYAVDINELQMKQAIEGSKAALQQLANEQKAQMDAQVELHKANLKAQTDAHKNELQAETQRIAAANKPAAKES